MAGTVRARVKRGMLELLEKIDLPEGKEVSVTILETPTARGGDPPRTVLGRSMVGAGAGPRRW